MLIEKLKNFTIQPSKVKLLLWWGGAKKRNKQTYSTRKNKYKRALQALNPSSYTLNSLSTQVKAPKSSPIIEECCCKRGMPQCVRRRRKKKKKKFCGCRSRKKNCGCCRTGAAVEKKTAAAAACRKHRCPSQKNAVTEALLYLPVFKRGEGEFPCHG